MKKLIEFQEDKHSEVINIIAQFRAEQNTTFSEAVRRLILCSQNGNCPTPDEERTAAADPLDQRVEALEHNSRLREERVEMLEKKTDILVNASKAFKNFMERDDSGHS